MCLCARTDGAWTERQHVRIYFFIFGRTIEVFLVPRAKLICFSPALNQGALSDPAIPPSGPWLASRGGFFLCVTLHWNWKRAWKDIGYLWTIFFICINSGRWKTHICYLRLCWPTNSRSVQSCIFFLPSHSTRKWASLIDSVRHVLNPSGEINVKEGERRESATQESIEWDVIRIWWSITTTLRFFFALLLFYFFLLALMYAKRIDQERILCWASLPSVPRRYRCADNAS